MDEVRHGRFLTLVGVICISCSAVVGLDTESSTIPDGVVYTDVKKNLVNGNRGVLSCRFYGDPVAVYWVKGMVPENAPIQVVWHEGTKSGSRFEDGTYDMDDNYSLIIKEVQVTDTGRYICRVSNRQGVLIHNYTDVTLLYVGLETRPKISLGKTIAGILPCKLNVRPKVVTWKKGPTYSSAKILVAIDKYHNVGQISGPGYEEGLFNITTDYSLVIANVDIEDEGQYFCELLEVDTNTTFHDFTIVSVFELDDKTTVEPRNKTCCSDQTHIHLYVASGVAAAAIIVILVVFAIYFRKKLKSYRRLQESESCDPSQSENPTTSTDVSVMKGRISNVELWKLVQFSEGSDENDKLSEAIKQLNRGKPGYGTCSTDFQRLCRWRDSCAPTEQMDKLYKVCLQAEMGETVEKLKEFRSNGSQVVSKYDLEHILWQIGKKSSENITTLLSKLTNSPFSQESSVPANVRRALPELVKWTKGNHAINPVVTLSLQSDDLCKDDMYFFKVSEEDKSPVEGDIKLHVCNVSKAHCQKIISIISTKAKPKHDEETKVVDRILEENKTDLFNTYQMIKEWLDEQECSNYEKRITLRKAVEDAKKASTSNEIHLGEIKRLASNKGDAEVAYELLMKDIKPFAANLRLDESKLIKYKQVSSSPQSPKGTIGLVADVRAIKGKK